MLVSVTTEGGMKFRNITRASLPEGDVPPEGRMLTNEQFNDAVRLAAHATGGGSRVGKLDRELGREAMSHLVGHSVALMNEVRMLREQAAERERAFASALEVVYTKYDAEIAALKGEG